MFNIDQFRKLIIQRTLEDLNMYSLDAAELLVFTCATESDGGSFLHQVNGPALGIYQMEPATYNDIWQNHIYHEPKLALILFTSFSVSRMPSEERLIHDLRYATAMARIHYERVAERLPDAKNLTAIWKYYKQYYNTSEGQADPLKAFLKYNAFIANT